MRPSWTSAFIFLWTLGLAVLLTVGHTFPPEIFAKIIICGLFANTLIMLAMIWVFRFCRWLRRKQVEGDQTHE